MSTWARYKGILYDADVYFSVKSLRESLRVYNKYLAPYLPGDETGSVVLLTTYNKDEAEGFVEINDPDDPPPLYIKCVRKTELDELYEEEEYGTWKGMEFELDRIEDGLYLISYESSDYIEDAETIRKVESWGMEPADRQIWETEIPESAVANYHIEREDLLYTYAYIRADIYKKQRDLNMSRSFFIRDSHNKGCITVWQALTMLDVVQELSQYTVQEAEPEEYAAFLKGKIDRFECITLGKEKVSARGFELSYDNTDSSYEIRVFTPSSSADYETAFEYMKKLCAFLGNSEIRTEDGETYTADTIAAYDYKKHIRAALEEIYTNLKKSKRGYFEVFGLYRPAALNEKMVKKILKGGDAAAKFSSFITGLQNVAAYSAKQKLVQKDDGTLFGVYMITEFVSTIIPCTPCVAYENAAMAENTSISQWLIGLVVIDGAPDNPANYQVYKYIEHSKFVKKLPRKKYTVLDAKYVLIHGLTRKEIERIAK